MQTYVAKNKADWEELERLLKRSRSRWRRMSAEELSRLDVLFRRTTIHLARVATRTSDPQLLQYLNDLTAQAHALIYLPPRRFAPRQVGQFLLHGFAETIVRSWRYHAVSAALLLAGFFIAWLAAALHPAAAYAIMPPCEFRQPGATRDQLLEALRQGRDYSQGLKFFFASFLFSNNLKVGLMAIATGILAAIPTILLMIYNGMILGVFTATHHQAGIYGEYWAWILPHGITEIMAIVFCGGIGLMLGRAIVCPGSLSRTASLRVAAGQCVRIIIGVALMLVLAAIIESYLRQSQLTTALRLAFAAGTALFWTVYFWAGAKTSAARR